METTNYYAKSKPKILLTEHSKNVADVGLLILDKNFCNYVKPVGVGWTMTLAGGSKIPVQKIVPGLPKSVVVSTHFAQNGDKIIMLNLKVTNEVYSGFIVTGQLSDYKLSTDADIESMLQKLISTLQRIGPNDGYSISKD